MILCSKCVVNDIYILFHCYNNGRFSSINEVVTFSRLRKVAVLNPTI